MKISFLEDTKIIAENENGEKFRIEKTHICGTCYDCWYVYQLEDNYEYEIRDYTTLEDALKDCSKGFIKVF